MLPTANGRLSPIISARLKPRQVGNNF
jgi:hypothetical protein